MKKMLYILSITLLFGLNYNAFARDQIKIVGSSTGSVVK